MRQAAACSRLLRAAHQLLPASAGSRRARWPGSARRAPSEPSGARCSALAASCVCAGAANTRRHIRTRTQRRWLRSDGRCIDPSCRMRAMSPSRCHARRIVEPRWVCSFPPRPARQKSLPYFSTSLQSGSAFVGCREFLASRSGVTPKLRGEARQARESGPPSRQKAARGAAKGRGCVLLATTCAFCAQLEHIY